MYSSGGQLEAFRRNRFAAGPCDLLRLNEPRKYTAPRRKSALYQVSALPIGSPAGLEWATRRADVLRRFRFSHHVHHSAALGPALEREPPWFLPLPICTDRAAADFAACSAQWPTLRECS